MKPDFSTFLCAKDAACKMVMNSAEMNSENKIELTGEEICALFDVIPELHAFAQQSMV